MLDDLRILNGQRPKPAKPGFLLGLAPWAASAVELVADDMWRDAGCNMLGRRGGLPESQGLLQDDHDALQCVKMTKGHGICQKCLFRYSRKRIFMSCNESEITASIIYQCISYSKSL